MPSWSRSRLRPMNHWNRAQVLSFYRVNSVHLKTNDIICKHLSVICRRSWPTRDHLHLNMPAPSCSNTQQYRVRSPTKNIFLQLTWADQLHQLRSTYSSRTNCRATRANMTAVAISRQLWVFTWAEFWFLMDSTLGLAALWLRQILIWRVNLAGVTSCETSIP